MTHTNASDALLAHGYCPRTTPVDTLMNAPYAAHLAVADAMEDDGDYPDYDLDGFQEADLYGELEEAAMSRILEQAIGG